MVLLRVRGILYLGHHAQFFLSSLTQRFQIGKFQWLQELVNNGQILSIGSVRQCMSTTDVSDFRPHTNNATVWELCFE